MLADDDVADAELAQLAVHVVDEALGEAGGGRSAVGRLLEPQQHERQHGRDHVEAAVDRVGHRALQIPVRRARARDDRVVQRQQRLVVASIRTAWPTSPR